MEKLRFQYQRIFFDYEKLSNVLVRQHLNWGHWRPVPGHPILTHHTVSLSTGVANKQARQARFFSSIVSEERFYSDYFFVGFFGKGFPANLANRQFIFKGYELEVCAPPPTAVRARGPVSSSRKWASTCPRGRS